MTIIDRWALYIAGPQEFVQLPATVEDIRATQVQRETDFKNFINPMVGEKPLGLAQSTTKSSGSGKSPSVVWPIVPSSSYKHHLVWVAYITTDVRCEGAATIECADRPEQFSSLDLRATQPHKEACAQRGTTLEEMAMAWVAPIVEEICVGMEVTSYDSADLPVEF